LIFSGLGFCLVAVMDAKFCQLIGLLVACPSHGGNPAHCQLHQMRLLPMSDRFTWARELPPAEIQRIIATHQQCSCDVRAIHRHATASSLRAAS
jgi:hypothetical protein